MFCCFRHYVAARRNVASAVLICCGLINFSTWQNACCQEPPLRIRLKDGSFGVGSIVPLASADRIGWQSPGFAEPFEFDIDAIRTISPSADAGEKAVDPKSQFVIEMLNGAALIGLLVAMDEGSLTIQSELLGIVKLDRAVVLAIVDASYAGRLVYSGPMDDDRWKRLGDEEDWSFEGGALTTKKPGSRIVGNVGLSAKSQIDLTLTWGEIPDFVLSFGTLATNQISKIEEVPSAARLEVWDRQLALVREVDGGADIAMLAELSSINPKIDLTMYLDQEQGKVIVCDASGRPMETLSVPGNRSIVRPSVHLANHGPALTVERFEVREWDGVTAGLGSAAGSIATHSETTFSGVITNFDADKKQFTVRRTDGSTAIVGLDDLRRGDVAGGGGPNTDPTAREAYGEDRTTIELNLLDRSRLIGRWLPAVNEKLRFAANGISEDFEFEPNIIRGVIGNLRRFAPEPPARLGTLKTSDQQLAGFLLETSPAGSRTGLHWTPLGSNNSSEIHSSASGAIVYYKPLPEVKHEAQPEQNLRRRVLAPDVGMFLGGRQAETSKGNESRTGAKANDLSREIMFRTGDAIDGVVERIDEQGMSFRSAQTQTKFAKHDQIQHVWLNRKRNSVLLPQEKMERLMTIPRALKNDPPTHLFVSTTGDYLRGRLVELNGEKIRVEVRGEVVELPASQVAQVVWLHDRDWSGKGDPKSGDKAPEGEASIAGKDGNGEDPFYVHAITNEDQGLTFQPQSLEGGTLKGVSDLLGPCVVAIENLNQILFGQDIGDEVREFRNNPWKLSLAQYPKVYLEDSQPADAPNNQSPLVGMPAPDFSLESLGGDAFRLSNNRDRVVVLDFWASWCGPCIQTMPQVEEVVNDFGLDKVHLVAVNIQETAARAKIAVDRLNLSATVLLDADGQTAAVYSANAIPQTVIIDRDGNITHVFVGGGPRFVEQFREALRSVVP